MSSSNRLVVDPVEDNAVGEFRSPLRGHMSSTMDGCVGKVAAITKLGITTNLSADEELLPGLGNWPSEVLNPCAGSIRRNSHIGISGVLEHSVLVAEVNIHFNRACRVSNIVIVDFSIAKVPNWRLSNNVELLFYSCIVQVVNHGLGINAWRSQFQGPLA